MDEQEAFINNDGYIMFFNNSLLLIDLKRKIMEHQKQRSSFINVFAWISIVFSGFGILIGIMQNVMMQSMMKDANFEQALNQNENLPPLMKFMFENFELLVMVSLLITIVLFIASIGLLKRKNWARLFFIVFLMVGIIWTVVMGVMQFSFMDSMMTASTSSQNLPSDFQNMQNTMQIVMGIMIVAIVALYTYLIKRLSSDEIKKEFV